MTSALSDGCRGILMKSGRGQVGGGETVRIPASQLQAAGVVVGQLVSSPGSQSYATARLPSQHMTTDLASRCSSVATNHFVSCAIDDVGRFQGRWLDTRIKDYLPAHWLLFDVDSTL